MVLSGTLAVGILIAFALYIQRFFDPIRSLTMQYSVMQRAMASGQRQGGIEHRRADYAILVV